MKSWMGIILVVLLVVLQVFNSDTWGQGTLSPEIESLTLDQAISLALGPLAFHGGPLWEPLCYAQIGGLTVATCITLLLVPVLYAICVLDLKIVKWESRTDRTPET